MIDLLGSIVIELRDDGVFSTWHEDRVRGEEPAPGDANGAGDYQRFVVVSALPGIRLPRVPVQFPRYVVTCYGVTPQDAMAGYGIASDVLSNAGNRVRANGHAIYNSLDDTGATPDRDPGTGQPRAQFVVQVIGSTQVVAA